jgi:carboxypeptidase Q
MRCRLTPLLLLACGASAPAEEVDLGVVHRIKAEAFQNSQVMEHLFWLTDVNGPRLTASPGFQAAADWAVTRLSAFGLTNVKQEPWGRFGRSWALRRFSAHMTAPVYAPLLGMPKAWSSGTNGPASGNVVAAPLFESWEDADREDLPRLKAHVLRFIEQQRGKLNGKVVLIEPWRELPLPTEPPSRRYDDAKLAELATAPEPFKPPSYERPLPGLPADPRKREQLRASLPDEIDEEYYGLRVAAIAQLNGFLRAEGVVAVLATDGRGSGGIVFSEEAGAWESGAPTPPPVVVLPPEPYARIFRLVANKVPVRIEVDMAVDFPEEARDAFNVVAELPGAGKKDEVVMLGAHLDSWHTGTGATDNAAGCAIAIEAMRILKTLGLPMSRSVRLALWSGEEQALYGSRAYVKQHFGDPNTMTLKPEHAKLAAYLNVDNGTGKIRGVYLQGNDMVRPIFERWLAPFHDLGATALSIRNTGGTDHLSFDAVGLPGFQFIQDPLDYETRTHHSNLDVYDHLQSSDLMQASAVLASFVYEAATRPEMLPRKPLPRPLPKKGE